MLRWVAALDRGKADAWQACVRVPHASPGPAGGCRKSAATPPPPRRCWSWRTGCVQKGRHPGSLRSPPATTGRAPTTCWRPKASSAGWSTPAMSRTCQDGPRLRVLTPCGWPRSPRAGHVLVRRWCTPPPIRRLRDLTRYRLARLIRDRTREMQRVEKLLEDAQIKISSVLSDIHGVSGRAMMEALIAGQRDPWSLARLAKGNARKKTDRLEEALRGFFTDHHATILQMMLDNIDRIGAQIAALDARIAEAIGPFSRPAAQLADIPGVDTVAAAELIAEIGVDMARFPTAAHLVSWAKFCPQTHQSAGKSRSKARGKGNPWLAGTVGRIVFSATRTDTFLGARYRRLARRRGKPKAIVAVGNSVLTIVYHLLSDADLDFCELGPAHYESRINKNRRARDLATQLQALTGQRIVIRDGKAIITDNAA